MKVLHLNTYESTGGAARAAARLHRSLRAIGVDSHELVAFGDESEHVHRAGGAAAWRRRFERLPLLAYPQRTRAPFTPAWARGPAVDRVRALAPDVVHLHWIADGLLPIEALPALDRPLVWTLHDSWAFTGGCHVPHACTRWRERCGRCPVLGSTREADLSRRVWERKRRAWERLPLVIVTPSRWLAESARASSLLGGVRCEVIPNGLDLARYRVVDRGAARARLGVVDGRKLVVAGGLHFGADPNKGFDLAVEAVRKLATLGAGDVELLIFGTPPGFVLPPLPMPARTLGAITDEDALIELLGAADVFVAPSRQENLPNLVMEAMACGTPCVAFNAGGTPDLIEHERTGWLAPPEDAEALARGVAWVLADAARRRALGAEARRVCEERFEAGDVARRYAALYEEVVRAGRS